MSKPAFLPTRCIFCARSYSKRNRRSEEHILPQWSHPLLDRKTEPTFATRLSTSFQEDGKTALIFPNIKKRSGDPASIAPRVVCADCNGSWMSRYEELVRPTLTPMIEGSHVTINAEDQLAIAHWAAIKTMVGEYDDQGQRVIDTAEHHRFYTHRTLSPWWKVAIGSYSGDAWRLRYRHATGHLMPETIPQEQRSERVARKGMNAQWTVLGMKHLIVVTLYSSEMAFKEHIDERYGLRSIFPSTERSITWPGPPVLSDASMEEFTQHPFPPH